MGNVWIVKSSYYSKKSVNNFEKSSTDFLLDKIAN